MDKIIVICGPTGVGKTALSVEIAKKFQGEVVYADSGAVWKGLNIGTAKPSFEERQAVPHHLIDVVEPNEHFDVGRYVELADSAIKGILERRRLPIVVGGTGLYIKALIYGISKMPSWDENFRKSLPCEGLYEQLQEKDPVSAKRLKPNDRHRIIRALEILHLTGRPISEFQSGFKTARYNALKIGLNIERAKLYNIIDARVDKMVKDGLFEEARMLFEKYGANCQAFQAVGYNEFSIDLIKRNSRRYAKRQLTWFRADKEIKWFQPSDINGLFMAVSDSFFKRL